MSTPGPRILRVGFSPVKGTAHLDLPRIEVDPHGVVGDRRWCFVDPVERRVLRTVQHPGLVALHAVETRSGTGTGARPSLSITAPDGERVVAVPTPTGRHLRCDYWGREVDLALMVGPHAALVGRVLGRDVALAAAPPRGVVYGAGLTLLTRASLDELAARTGTAVDPARFRASAVIETDEAAGAEDGWAGRELRLGTATVKVGAPVGRCAVIDLDPRTGERAGRLLRALADYRPRTPAGEPAFGVYAEVVTPGLIRVT
ncbi:MOSC N-terminal beta barrel domain-containing protein [Nocardioides sp.]|uniref:MOSC domain-containing protein n=1 Tax=Nocardioides sp. TaxID=35761 RepID=UPI002615AFD7|nr:MOSC N-terminal beta barrel domain-containing protein [Nocardioides sp.]